MENVIKSSPCVLMFDGFDEVLSHQISIAKRILKLVAKLEYAQLFVTTRPHMREELENSLEVLGYTIQPFDDANQLSFMLAYWETKGIKRNGSVEQFAKTCLKSLNRDLSDFENQIAGIPLQCKMLAEAYTESAKQCSGENQQSIKLITSVFEMYERHMSMRFDGIFKKGSCLKCLKRVHTYLALKLLFPEHEDEFDLLNDESISKSEICVLGIVEGTHSNDVRFVHRTFAEYLVAWYFVEKCGNHKNLIFKEIFSTSPKQEALGIPLRTLKLIESFQFKFPVVCYFINEFMKRQHQQNLEGPINNLTTLSLLHKQVAPIIFASAYHNYAHVLMGLSKVLGATNQQQQESYKIDISDLLLIASNYGDVELVKIVCEMFDIKSIEFEAFNKNPFITSPLHIAIQRGYYNLVAYLIKQHKEGLTKLPYLIHFCVYDSLLDNKATLNSKIKIIKLLCTKSKQWLDEPLPNRTKPLLQFQVNMELLECLIEQGADVNVVDDDDNTVLHKIFENSSSPITPEAYDKFVKTLDNNRFNLYCKQSLTQIVTFAPLHIALRNVNVLESTLEILHSKGANFNAICWNSCSNQTFDSVLSNAILGGRSVECIRGLIKYDADWRHVNMHGHGVLHVCAESGHLEALKYFLEFYQKDINVKADDLSTPLHRVVLQSSESHVIIEWLISKGANVNARTVNSKTPFELAFEEGEGLTLAIIQLMEQHGLFITGKIVDTVLKGAFTNTNLELDSKVIGEALHYLYGMQKTAVFRSHISWNPWKFESLQENLPKIINTTKVTSLLLQKAKEFQLFQMSDLKDLKETEEPLKSGRFYELVQRNEESFQKLCMSLLYGKQLHVLSCLIRSLATAEGDGKVFVTAPPGITQFICSEQIKGIVLVSTNRELTIRRIKETFNLLDSANCPIVKINSYNLHFNIYKTRNTFNFPIDVFSGNHNLASQLLIKKLTIIIFHSRTFTHEILNKLEELITTEWIIIGVCSEVIQKIPNWEIFTDSFGWEDISRKFYSLLRCTFGLSFVNFTDLFATPKIMQVFQEYFIHNSNLNVCIMTDFKVGHQLDEFEGTHLSSNVFHYFLPDKLIFLGITESELKKFAKYGQIIGCIGEHIDKLDYILAENLSEIEEFLKENETKQNVHLIEYKENTFCLVRTLGEDYNIKEFLEKPQICENFPACDCDSTFDQVVFNCTFCVATATENKTYEYSTTLNELLPNMLELLQLQDFIELAEVTELVEKFPGKPILHINLIEFEEETSKKNGKFEELEQRIIQLLAYMNISDEEYRDLGKVAESTIFPGRITNQGIKTLGRFITVGLLAKKQDSLVVVNQSLACYLVANSLVKNEFNENLARDLFRDCVEPHSVRKPIPYFSSGLDTDFSTKSTIKFQSLVMESYKFAHGQLLKFVESLAIKNIDVIQDQLQKHIPSHFIVPWVQACVLANHYNLLQILVSLESYAPSSQSEEETIILAVLYAEVSIINLLIDKFNKKTNKKVERITLNLSDKKMEDDKNVDQDAPPPKRYKSDKKMEEDEEKKDALQPSCDKEFQTISLLHLAAFRGDYSVMDYLIKNHFQDNLSQRQLRDTLIYSVIDTQNQQSDQIQERKRIIELLLQFSPKLISQRDANYCHPLIAPNIHVDLIIFLIEKGLEDECSLRAILHFCPTYMTPQEYHRLIQDLFDRGKAEILHLTGKSEKTPLHRAVQHFEPRKSTIKVFKSAKFDFNNGIIFTAVEHKERSVRLLESLIRAGADFQKSDKDGWSVLHHAAASENVTALRYFIFRKCDVNASNSDKNTPLHLLLNSLNWRPPKKITHELVQVLIQNGADVNAVGEYDCTPLSIAVEKNKGRCLENRTLELMKNKAGTS